MNEKRVRRNVKTNSKAKVNTQKKSRVNMQKKIKQGRKKNIKPIIIVDYIFLISLVLSIIFGMQTNGVFFIPFTISLVITIVCMSIILINSINNKIKKMFKKGEK